jgi:hypothetical protein
MGNKNSRLSGLCWSLGSFEPRRTIIDGIEFYEDKGIKYLSKKISEIKRVFRWRNSALKTGISFVYLLHRSDFDSPSK